jgi:hypothetical protein
MNARRAAEFFKTMHAHAPSDYNGLKQPEGCLSAHQMQVRSVRQGEQGCGKEGLTNTLNASQVLCSTVRSAFPDTPLHVHTQGIHGFSELQVRSNMHLVPWRKHKWLPMLHARVCTRHWVAPRQSMPLCHSTRWLANRLRLLCVKNSFAMVRPSNTLSAPDTSQYFADWRPRAFYLCDWVWCAGFQVNAWDMGALDELLTASKEIEALYPQVVNPDRRYPSVAYGANIAGGQSSILRDELRSLGIADYYPQVEVGGSRAGGGGQAC